MLRQGGSRFHLVWAGAVRPPRPSREFHLTSGGGAAHHRRVGFPRRRTSTRSAPSPAPGSKANEVTHDTDPIPRIGVARTAQRRGTVAALTIIAIGTEAGRIKNLANDVPKKTAKVDKAAARIAEAAGAILEEVNAMAVEAPAEAPAAARRGLKEVGWSSIHGWIYPDGSPAPAPAPPPPPTAEQKRRGEIEEQTLRAHVMWRASTTLIDKGDAEAAQYLFEAASQEHDATPALRISRAGSAILAEMLAIDGDVRPHHRELSAAIAEMLNERLQQL